MSGEMRRILVGGLSGLVVAIVLWAAITISIYGWVLLGASGTLAGIVIALGER